jgi:hypothetical protein
VEGRPIIPGGLLALAIGSLAAIVLPNHLVVPSGGCPPVYDGPGTWTNWLFYALVPLGLSAAALSAGSFLRHAGQPVAISVVFALVGGVGWILLLYVGLFAFPPPCR